MKRYLFLVDLDGTLLDDSATNKINSYSKGVIKKVVSQGHFVCLITGRPWRSTKSIYEELGLNTVVGNYNGAFIHNPKDPSFIPKIVGVSLHHILYIKGDKAIKDKLDNFVIEGLNWIQMEKKDPSWESLLAIEEAQKFKVGEINYNDIILKPITALLNLRLSSHEVYTFQKYLRSKYADIADFPVWRKQEEPSVYTFAIVPRGISKTIVLSLLIRYYGVDFEDVVTFGDAYNDLEVFKNSFISVAMANAEEILKDSAIFISNFSNKEGAVGKFMEDFLNDPHFYVEEAKKIREAKFLDKTANY